MVEGGAIKFGEFKLTHLERPSKFYVDIKKAATDPAILEVLTEQISKRVTAGRVAGVELGAVPLLVAVSMRLGVPYVIIRREASTHGTGERLIGEIRPNEAIDIIEDVATTGKTAVAAARLLRDRGARVARVICVVDREEGAAGLLGLNGLELVALLRASELLASDK